MGCRELNRIEDPQNLVKLSARTHRVTEHLFDVRCPLSMPRATRASRDGPRRR